MQERDSMEFDVVIVGAGPSGLSAAIRLKQKAVEAQKELSVCVIEKGSEVGAHILSGAVLEPRALDSLLPDWQERHAPLNTPVTEDAFYFLKEQSYRKLPVPPTMHNKGNYIISLGNFCRFLAEQATELGVEIYPGFPAAKVAFDNDGHTVTGVITQDMGIDREGKKKDSYQPGMLLKAKYTLFGEGCRGSLSEQLMKQFNLRQSSDPQTYGIGIKELWEIDPAKSKQGEVIHTIGWPLDNRTYGGSFLYHMEKNQLAIGLVVGLDYKNPYLSPFNEMQRLKNHPLIRPLLENAKRVAYGARALNEGGFQSIPELTFPGGAIIGCAAGFMNVPKIKGTHTAMQSGIYAADAAFDAIDQQRKHDALVAYPQNIKKSWVYKELYHVRNIKPAFRYGLLAGLAYAALDTYILRGKAPWTFRHHPDHQQLGHFSDYEEIHYPKPDGIVSFDLLSSVFLSNTNHEEDQPVHLRIKDPHMIQQVNLEQYAGPEARYCPAGVYEYVDTETLDGKELRINAQNCLHCKTCDIKDPSQNIEWVTPEGSGGPNYPNM